MHNYDNLIWNRIYRNGKICSNDLQKLLSITSVHSSRIIKSFLDRHSDKVFKKGRFLTLFPQEKPPESIINTSLINQISVAINQPIITGLFDEEIPIVESSLSYSQKIDNFMLIILKAIRQSKSIEAVYVSLTYRSSPTEKEKPRILFPISFKFFDGFWYLIAVDKKSGQEDTLKMFALNRFQHISISDEKFKYKSINDKKKIRFFLIFNSAFTNEQKNIIIDELGLKKHDDSQYVVDIFEYEKFSFKRKYLSEEKPTADSKSIYPFFTSYSEQPI